MEDAMPTVGGTISRRIARQAWTAMTAGVVALLAAGCQDNDPAGLRGMSKAAAVTQAANPTASPLTLASGTLMQTGVISEDVPVAGPNTIVELTIAGTINGTLSGTTEDRFRLVIHPNGKFTAQGTTICVCTVEGRSGILELLLTDTGEILDGVPVFKGRWVIRRGRDELSGLRGVLQVEGEVDLMTNLSIIEYSGWIKFHPEN
jgi:hypothetical protein